MDYHVIEARYVAGHVVWLRFRDGTSGEIDLAPALRGPIFEPLRNPEIFRQFRIHPDFHTLAWPNGADFAPDFLYELVEASDTRSNQNLYHAGRAAPGQAGHIIADKDDES